MSLRPIVAVVAGVVLLAVVTAWPVYETYTYLKDDRATARVQSCGKGRWAKCEVTWRAPDGRQGTGKVSTSHSSDRNEDIDVRIAPSGAVREVGNPFFLISYVIPLSAWADGDAALRARREDGTVTVSDLSGTPLFAARKERTPGLCLLAPDGSGRATLERTSRGGRPGGDVVTADRRTAGSLTAESETSVWAFVIRNEHGDQVGMLARHGFRDWVLHLRDGSPEVLHHIGLAAALDIPALQSLQD